MLSTDIAYLAGLVDGDGCFTWTWDNSTIRLQVQVTHPYVVEYLYETFGGRIGTVRRQNVSPRTTRKSRDIHTWVIGASILRELLPELNRYMVIKKRHGEVILEALELRTKRGSGSKQIDEQRKLYEELRRLNDRTLPE